jgi:BASS family bile acid:Na+ symporter
MICGSVVAQNAGVISLCGMTLLKAVLSLHAFGFALGYLAPRSFGYPRKTCKTVSIETGMQNSALAVVLANGLGIPEAAIPGAVSATVHSCLGSMLASLWRWREGGMEEGEGAGGDQERENQT